MWKKIYSHGSIGVWMNESGKNGLFEDGSTPMTIRRSDCRNQSSKTRVSLMKFINPLCFLCLNRPTKESRRKRENVKRRGK